MGAAIDVKGLAKSYKRIVALAGVDLTLEPGTIMGLVGPNGSGKTTAIRCILGIEKADRGEVSVLGRPMPQGRKRVLESVGYMPQDMALYPDLTVSANLDFFARVFGIKGSERKEAEAKALDVVKLADRADSKIGELSGGMRRRASLACAIQHSPSLLILDEPTVGVDPDLRANMWATFREMTAAGAAILLTTHYLEEAERCDRVLFIREGKLIGNGTPAELLSRTGTKRLEDAFLSMAGGSRPAV
ncbi:MAG: ABC transporter ATP-binding protein [Euryarchaeota archaeon]|nr:ABC transporter ATP-binding protein [Euryarchaeota archaeon]